MTEIEITSGRINEMIDPVLHIWGMDVAIYLFLGGMAAGLMIIPSLWIVRNTENESQRNTALPLLLVPVLLSVGMFFLFLDLHYKIHVFRFYTTFQPASPMSWGAWILVFVYPISFVLGLLRLKTDFPTWYEKLFFAKNLLNPLKNAEKVLAYLNIFFGIALGIYTGILLSSYVARPLWNSGLLSVLFLVSGVSTGAALLMILSRNHDEQRFLSRMDIGLIVAELSVIGLFFIGLLTSSLQSKEAASLFLGGEYTANFWVLVVGAGLLTPLILELFELKGKRVPVLIPALLILGGGFLLRVLILSAGQVSTYLPY